MRQNDEFFHPQVGFVVASVKINRADEGFQGVSENLGAFEGIVEFIEHGYFFEAHLQGNLIELLPIHHFAAHFRKKAFTLVGIFSEEVMSDYGTQYRIP